MNELMQLLHYSPKCHIELQCSIDVRQFHIPKYDCMLRIAHWVLRVLVILVSSSSSIRRLQCHIIRASRIRWTSITTSYQTPSVAPRTTLSAESLLRKASGRGWWPLFTKTPGHSSAEGHWCRSNGSSQPPTVSTEHRELNTLHNVMTS